jgi:predicted negative regulator of RcsB-dependent stress response
VMSSSVATAPVGSEALSPAGDDAASPSNAGVLVLLIIVVLLGAACLWGYTQWWVPRQEAQQLARVQYGRCLDEVRAYKGKASYDQRVAQCESTYAEASAGPSIQF